MEQRPLSIEIDAVASLDVSIVMPCLDEIESLPHCIANAQAALADIEARCGVAGEIIVADNGSTDGSQDMARSLGARVVAVPVRGYGAALIGGCSAAFGRYIVIGDADGSYDFRDSVSMVERLIDGADICMGSRFRGGIANGAMPWKNRHIGNPLLTGILNLFFGARVEDAHCGLRAMTRACFRDLGLSGTGMEFASEMIIKAALKRKRIDQAPASLSCDLRQRAPHLRPWRDGWRHLRYLLMLSPTWLFGLPATLAMVLGTAILAAAGCDELGFVHGFMPFGASWTIVGGFLLTVGHFAALMAVTTYFYGVRRGYRRLRPWLAGISAFLTLESALIVGSALMTLSLLGFIAVAFEGSTIGYMALPSILPVTIASVLGSIGMQTALGGFVLAIIADHDVRLTPSVPMER